MFYSINWKLRKFWLHGNFICNELPNIRTNILTGDNQVRIWVKLDEIISLKNQIGI